MHKLCIAIQSSHGRPWGTTTEKKPQKKKPHTCSTSTIMGAWSQLAYRVRASWGEAAPRHTRGTVEGGKERPV